MTIFVILTERIYMATIKKIATAKTGQNANFNFGLKSYANDPYVIKKVEQAKEFIKKAGFPNLKK